MATYDEKVRAYKDAVEIAKAAYGSSTDYRGASLMNSCKRLTTNL